MTDQDALQEVIDKGDPAGCINFFKEMPEAERRKLAPLALKQLKETWQAVEADPGVFTAKANKKLEQRSNCANLSVWATATLSEMKKAGWRVRPESENNCIAILKDRQPPWIDDCCDWLLEQWPFCWSLVRALMKEELCGTPKSDAYVLAMINGMGNVDEKSSIAAGLEAEPDLLRDTFWRLFEVEGGGDLSLAAFDKYAPKERGWEKAVCDLCAKGLVERDRVLDASLDALNRDFAQFRAGWYSRLHEALAPDLEERRSRQDRYLALLGSPIPPTVSFAMKALKVLEAKGHLPGAEFLDAVEPVLFAKSKSTVVAALKMISALVKKDGGLSSQGAFVASIGLEHGNNDVQEQALSLVIALGDPGDAALRESTASRRELVGAALRPKLDDWLGDIAETVSPAEGLPVSTGVPNVDLDSLDEGLCRLAAIPVLLKEQEELTGNIPAAPFQVLDIPVLAKRESLAPVETVEDLIDLLLEVIESQQDTDASERALDGLARLSDQRPADFEVRSKPLAKRLAQLRKSITWVAPETWCLGVHAVCQAADGWLGSELGPLRADKKGEIYIEYEGEHHVWTVKGYVASKDKPGFNLASQNLDGILYLRGRMVAEMAAQGIVAPLLSAATHSGGWLSPQTFVERTNVWVAQNRDPGLPDLVLGMLRLAPDGRAAALNNAKKLPGEWGAAVRYALGGSEKIGKTAPLWVAACRARAPYEDDPAVVKAFKNLGPDGARAAKYKYRVDAKQYDEFTIRNLEIDVEPKLKDEIGTLRSSNAKDRIVSTLPQSDLAASRALLPTVGACLDMRGASGSPGLWCMAPEPGKPFRCRCGGLPWSRGRESSCHVAGSGGRQSAFRSGCPLYEEGAGFALQLPQRPRCG